MRRRDLEVLLGRAERSIALLERCRPLNYPEERAELLAALRHGAPRNPRFCYAPSATVQQLCAGLGTVAAVAEQGGAWGALYAQRAYELHLEAAIVAAVGTPQGRDSARIRFGANRGVEVEAARELAMRWAVLPAEVDEGLPRYVSDDAQQPWSLVSAMRRAVGEARIGFRVVTNPDLTSAAATGDGVIVVRAGIELTERAAKRVVMHEVLGHALPRHHALSEEIGLFRVGSAGGPDEEEGRALLIESRLNLMDPERKRQLGLRHLAARSVHAGATWVETARELRGLGSRLVECVDIASRAHRGGGLGREVVYLESYLRLQSAFASDAAAERPLERGRVSVECGRLLSTLGRPPETLPTVRAA
jgi:hypothetical protein